MVFFFLADEHFPHRDFLNSVASKCRMAKIDQVEEIVLKRAKGHDFKGEVFPLVLIGLLEIQAEVSGKNLEQDLESIDPSDLVCRCFGVSESQIEKFMSENDKAGLMEVTDETLAGGACTRCHSDIKQVIRYYNPPTDALLKNKGLSEVQLVYKVQDFLNSWPTSYKIKKVVGREIQISAQVLDPFKDILKMEQEFEKREGLPVRFLFTTSAV